MVSVAVLDFFQPESIEFSKLKYQFSALTCLLIRKFETSLVSSLYPHTHSLNLYLAAPLMPLSNQKRQRMICSNGAVKNI